MCRCRYLLIYIYIYIYNTIIITFIYTSMKCKHRMFSVPHILTSVRYVNTVNVKLKKPLISSEIPYPCEQ